MPDVGGCIHIGILPAGTAHSLIGSIQQAPNGRLLDPVQGQRQASRASTNRCCLPNPFRRSDGNATESLAPRARSQPRVAMTMASPIPSSCRKCWPHGPRNKATVRLCSTWTVRPCGGMMRMPMHCAGPTPSNTLAPSADIRWSRFSSRAPRSASEPNRRRRTSLRSSTRRYHRSLESRNGAFGGSSSPHWKVESSRETGCRTSACIRHTRFFTLLAKPGFTTRRCSVTPVSFVRHSRPATVGRT